MDAILAGLLGKGAPLLMLSFAEPFLSSFIIYFFMRKLLPNRLKPFALSGFALVYALWINLRSPALLGTNYHLWMNMFINVWQYCIILFFFRGVFWKKLIVWWYFDITKAMSQAVAYVPVLLYHAFRGAGGGWAQVVASVETDAWMRLLHIAVYIPVFLLLCFLSLTIWRKILMESFHPFYLLFFALPMGFRYSLARVIQPNMGDWFLGILLHFGASLEEAYDILSLFGIAMGFAASAAALLYILSQDKRAAIEAELLEAKREMEIEQARYREAEKRSEELERIRHDFNNQLASIRQLLRLGEDKAAQSMIAALAGEIDETPR